MASPRKKTIVVGSDGVAGISNEQLNELLRCVPGAQIDKKRKEELRRRVAGAIADKKKVQFAYQNFAWNRALEIKLASLRRHLSEIRILLSGHAGVIAILNSEANICADDEALGFELTFDADRNLSVRGPNLVAMTAKCMGMLEALARRSQEKVAHFRVKKGGNNHRADLFFFASALNVVFKDIFGDDRELIGMTYNETTGQGSPLIEFVRCCSRLTGESDDGNTIKQRLLAIKKKAKADNDWAIQF